VKIESVDFFYLSMPEVTNAADGSQDALIVRITAGGLTGWGECEAAPLPSIAAFIAPKSHGACRPIAESVIGQRLDGPADVGRIGDLVRVQSMDLLQTAHTLSGIDMALWDLVGKRLDAPIYQLIGYPRAYAKTPYASQLFGATPQEMLEKCRNARALGFRATKLGWAPFDHYADPVCDTVRMNNIAQH
jgi:L-alanine-DL-glutamate epimerase-like enolase superfamily enzyme